MVAGGGVRTDSLLRSTKNTRVEERDTNPTAIAAFPAYSSARVHFATFVPAQQNHISSGQRGVRHC